MNLFFLSWSAKLCAKYHFNRHVVKMISELCQMLSTAHWLADEAGQCAAWLAAGKLMRATHANHPTCKWVRTHANNYRFAAALALALCDEFEQRFSGAAHSSRATLEHLASQMPRGIDSSPDAELHFEARVTMPPQCFGKGNDHLAIAGNPIEAYRNYYRSESKSHLRWWRPVPQRVPIIDDDAVDFAPDWFGTCALAPPKYYTQALEKQSRVKRARLAVSDECSQD